MLPNLVRSKLEVYRGGEGSYSISTRKKHTTCPFGLHNHHIIPSSKQKCTKKRVKEEQVGIPCEALNFTSLYGSIMDRIKYGVHENTPLQYHGIGGLITAVQRKNEEIRCLRMTKLNSSRQIKSLPMSISEPHGSWLALR